MMTQGQLPIQYQSEKNESSLTSFAGLPLYLELMIGTGLTETIRSSFNTKQQGWADLQILTSLLLLNIAGGDCVDDIERLENDAGLRTILLKLETHGMSRKARREYEKRWRKEKQRGFPSASVIRRFLEGFHNAEQEELRENGVAFIPEKNELLKKLINLNDHLMNSAQVNHPSKVATLDMDATLSNTHKRSAFFFLQELQSVSAF